MRVRKICTICGTLKSMSDFSNSEEYPDKKTRECKTCIDEIQFGEYNSKINNNQTKKTMATLAEKREAAKAAEAKGETPKTTPTPKTSAPKTTTPKVGETTKDGLKVVGEKKEAGSRGRKKQEDNRPVEQLDLETGTIVIATFPTIAAAAEAVGTNYQYLYDGLRGWTKSVAKFKWRYEGEEIYVRPVKAKSDAEKAFLGETPVTEETVDETFQEETPVPGDLDYDPETHGVEESVEEETGEDLLETTEE
jgi:hypothetical protein